MKPSCSCKVIASQAVCALRPYNTVFRVLELCDLTEENVVKFLQKADRMRPAYCIALRPEKKQVLLVVRGTKSIGDAITILTGISLL